MTNLTDCVRLYLTDDQVTDAQFRSIIIDAAARDAVDAAGSTPDRTESEREDLLRRMIDDRLHALIGIVTSLTEGIQVLDEIDDRRAEEIEAISNRLEAVTRAVFSNGNLDHSKAV